MAPFNNRVHRQRRWMLFTVLLGCPTAAVATGGAPPRTAMPEPLIGESITDVDGTEAGEMEIDLTGGLLGRSGDGAMLWSSNLEVEYRAHKRVGLAVELGVDGTAGLGPIVPSEKLLSLRVAGSCAVLHDFKRDLHSQAAVSAKLFAELWSDGDFNLGESALPYSFRIHGAWRRGGFNLRAGVGAAVSGTGVYTLLLINAAVLYDWGSKVGPMRRAFVGFELDVDGARSSPLVLIPEVAVAVAPLDVPVRLGLAVPVAPNLTAKGVTAGALLRITAELDQD